MKNLVSTLFMVVFFISFSFSSETVITEKSYNVDLTTVTVNPFCMAIVKGDADTVKKLIELGSDVNEKSEGMTPLMYAARYNRVDIMKLLIKNGAKIKTRDGKGYTAMKFAEIANAKDAIALLKESS